jgi:hypothetical protein
LRDAITKTVLRYPGNCDVRGAVLSPVALTVASGLPQSRP